VAKASEQRKAKMRDYYRNNRQAADARMVEWRYRKRLEFIEQLGGRCIYCGQDDTRVLDFDHIHNDPDKNAGGRRLCIIRYFSKHGVDSQRFQLLCKNCNWIKELERRKSAQRKQETT
jgi:transposase-like protein